MATFSDWARGALHRSASFLGFSVGGHFAHDAGRATGQVIAGDTHGAVQTVANAATLGTTNPDKTLLQKVAGVVDVFTAGLATPIVDKDPAGIMRAATTIAAVTQGIKHVEPVLAAALQPSAEAGALTRTGMGATRFAATKVALPLMVADTAVSTVNGMDDAYKAIKRGDYPAAVGHYANTITPFQMTNQMLDVASQIAAKVTGVDLKPIMDNMARTQIDTAVNLGYQGYDALRTRLTSGEAPAVTPAAAPRTAPGAAPHTAIEPAVDKTTPAARPAATPTTRI